MSGRALIIRTRSFASDSDGMPVSRQLALAEQPEPQQAHAAAEEPDVVEVWLAATGVVPIDYEQPETFAEAYLIATGVRAAVPTPQPKERAESDPLGAAWVAATTAGWAA